MKELHWECKHMKFNATYYLIHQPTGYFSKTQRFYRHVNIYYLTAMSDFSQVRRIFPVDSACPKGTYQYSILTNFQCRFIALTPEEYQPSDHNFSKLGYVELYMTMRAINPGPAFVFMALTHILRIMMYGWYCI